MNSLEAIIIERIRVLSDRKKKTKARYEPLDFSYEYKLDDLSAQIRILKLVLQEYQKQFPNSPVPTNPAG